MVRLIMFWFYCCALATILKTSSAIDTMFPNQTLKDGDTLVSEAEVFELGFFGLGNSTFRYLGIRYKQVSAGTIVWIANREVPLVDPTGVLKISDKGILELLSVSNTLIWSSQSSKPAAYMNPVAQLLDSGNLVIRDEISGDLIWQSFDHRGDTWLPGMQIGVDLVTGVKRNLTSWKTLTILHQWSSELLDIRVASETDFSGQDIYIKMPRPTTLIGDEKKSNSSLKVTMSIVFAVVLVGFALILYAWRKKKKSHRKVNKEQKQDSELTLFSLSKIIKATSNFSIDNKLGQGGFGAVYKGMLDEGGEIAVKRLSKSSKQGLEEFQNEVICIAKLQHRNLVKLLGYCDQGEEMMLIYEYMPNKSLDSLLFDENNSLLLDWPQRYHIINGIARGLLYLHQDSRLRIIHRDLKASNILLDSNMNPKISDFGLARMFKEYETEANTNKVVGTLGYISPEYASNGLFSVKSDIFSFGVLVLEIVSGKKNRGFSHQDHHNNLLGHAWRLYKEDKPLELVDTALGDSWINSQVLQSIHVGLSCVQQHAEDRPSMSSVIHMLSGEGALPPPQPPGFFTEVPKPEVKSNLMMPQVLVSINEVTVTQLEAR
ncbi:hypothetical protein L2E82_32419 [Cichorium intybus]|uniref:Uncharacterized protein n=1 Tax=Cichorium intybus TaxID=13427 RepID=A0ACB9BFW0_CICIN|nr:hypothetical protein L2E82_32419 [Cichorium intybus]